MYCMKKINYNLVENCLPSLSNPTEFGITKFPHKILPTITCISNNNNSLHILSQ